MRAIEERAARGAARREERLQKAKSRAAWTALDALAIVLGRIFGDAGVQMEAVQVCQTWHGKLGLAAGHASFYSDGTYTPER